MDRWQNRVAVVTGASSGIGEAVAKDLARAGLRVVALGRREQRLSENRAKLTKDEQTRFYPRVCDVSSEADVKATFEWIEETLGGTDILVNNAGTIHFGNLVDIDTKQVDEVLNTNVKGLIYCTQAAYKSMKARNFDGHIVHINSICGHKVHNADTSSNIYAPSKFASISPGAVRTEIVPKAVFDALGDLLSAEDVSQTVLFAISTPPHVQIHEITVKIVGEKF